ncbi:hypothetical protein ES707_14571 [subsurface metagenome]
MALEIFSVDDTLDDGEVYGQFTNQEGTRDVDSQVLGGVYKSEHMYQHGYLITTNNIAPTFSYQVDFKCVDAIYVMQQCGIYLGASAPTDTFDADDVNTNLVCMYARRGSNTDRFYVKRTNSEDVKEYWNFTTHTWQASGTSWDGYIYDNWYRFTFIRDATNTVLTIYDITGDTLIETITAVNSETKAIDNNAYFYFGVPENLSTLYESIGQWDNAGFEEEITKTFSELGSGSETLLTDKILLFTETGTGLEAFIIGNNIVVFSDAGVGAENLLINKILLLEDSGSGAEFWIANKLREFADSGVGIDVFLKDWTPLFTDLGSGVEAYYKVFPYPPNLKRIIILIRDRK